MRVVLLYKGPCETWSGDSFPGAINSALIGALHAVAALPGDGSHRVIHEGGRFFSP